jgi:GNAT superfamily N-acetyltransferase
VESPYVVEPLGRYHDRAAFLCGIPALDRYLTQQVSQDTKKGLAVAYVLRAAADMVVRGYYTVNMSSIEVRELPDDLARHLPYPAAPAALIGRIALHQQIHGLGLGGLLLSSALSRCLAASTSIGAMGVFVDAKNDAARAFYEHYGFIRLADDCRLFIPMKTVARLVRPG